MKPDDYEYVTQKDVLFYVQGFCVGLCVGGLISITVYTFA
jgi:hypothetical protein